MSEANFHPTPTLCNQSFPSPFLVLNILRHQAWALEATFSAVHTQTEASAHSDQPGLSSSEAYSCRIFTVGVSVLPSFRSP